VISISPGYIKTAATIFSVITKTRKAKLIKFNMCFSSALRYKNGTDLVWKQSKGNQGRGTFKWVGCWAAAPSQIEILKKIV